MRWLPPPRSAGNNGIHPDWFNVQDFGAVGDLTTDDTAAIQRAIDAIKASVDAVSVSNGGQTLYFPRGYYKVTSSLNMQGFTQVRIVGESGRGTWFAPDSNPPTAIAFYGTGSGVAVDLRGSHGCVWDGVSVIGRNASFTGTLLSFDSLVNGGNIFGHRVQNCTLYCIESATSALLSLAGNIMFSADNINFGKSGTCQIRGFSTTAPSTFSNANAFRSCSFIGARTYSILNAGPMTTYLDCTFEPSTSHITAPIMWNATGSGGPNNVNTFLGCSFWDNTGAGAWFESSVATNVMSLTGCQINVGTSPCFKLANHNQLTIIGCQFNGVGGAVNVFDPALTITGGTIIGCQFVTAVDNHASVFV